jgi:hypothetical protein
VRAPRRVRRSAPRPDPRSHHCAATTRAVRSTGRCELPVCSERRAVDQASCQAVIPSRWR